jgi:hypothetical protein
MRRGRNVQVSSWTSFSAAADEASVSRIYAGQHFGFDQAAGQVIGRRVAGYVQESFVTARGPGYGREPSASPRSCEFHPRPRGSFAGTA